MPGSVKFGDEKSPLPLTAKARQYLHKNRAKARADSRRFRPGLLSSSPEQLKHTVTAEESNQCTIWLSGSQGLLHLR